MSRTFIYSFIALSILLFSLSMVSCSEDKDDAFPEKVKISLRNVGHQLLLSNQDSTSLVLPVIELDRSKYELSFQQQLSFDPNTLVAIVDSSFQKLELPRYYRVEVIQCSDHEIAYSYEMNANKENTLIPCGGRFLPNGCYTIEVQFTNGIVSFFKKYILLYIIIFSGFAVLLFSFLRSLEI